MSDPATPPCCVCCGASAPHDLVMVVRCGHACCVLHRETTDLVTCCDLCAGYYTEDGERLAVPRKVKA